MTETQGFQIEVDKDGNIRIVQGPGGAIGNDDKSYADQC